MVEQRVGKLKVAQSQPTQPRKVVKLESLKQLNLNAAGLDIGAADIYAALIERLTKDSSPVEEP